MIGIESDNRIFDELMAHSSSDLESNCCTLRMIIIQQHPEVIEIVWTNQERIS